MLIKMEYAIDVIKIVVHNVPIILQIYVNTVMMGLFYKIMGLVHNANKQIVGFAKIIFAICV